MLNFVSFDEKNNSVNIQCTLKDIYDLDIAFDYAEKYIKKINAEEVLLDFINEKQNEIQELKNRTSEYEGGQK